MRQKNEWEISRRSFLVAPSPLGLNSAQGHLLACRSVSVTIGTLCGCVSTDGISDSIVDSEGQRAELPRIAPSRSLPAGHVFRARLILMRAEGAFYRPGKLRLRTTAPTIRRWKRRFATCGLDKSPRDFPEAFPVDSRASADAF